MILLRTCIENWEVLGDADFLILRGGIAKGGGGGIQNNGGRDSMFHGLAQEVIS